MRLKRRKEYNKKWKEEQNREGWDGTEQNRIREGRNRIELDNNKKWKEVQNREGWDGIEKNKRRKKLDGI